MSNPQIGLSMLYCLNEPFSSLLKDLIRVDTKIVELPDEGLHILNKNRAKKLNEIAQSYDLDYVIHAPWAGTNIAIYNSILRRAVLKRLTQSIIIAGQLDCRIWLFHSGCKTGLDHFYPGKDWELNLEAVQELLKIAQQEDVKIAIENNPEPGPSLMKSVGDFQRFYEDLNDDIGMVLDLAHSNINNQTQDFLKNFNNKIVHIHASDNEGDFDSHLGIGYGTIDWEYMAKLLKQAHYDKVVMIESIDHIKESINFLRELFS